MAVAKMKIWNLVGVLFTFLCVSTCFAIGECMDPGTYSYLLEILFDGMVV